MLERITKIVKLYSDGNKEKGKETLNKYFKGNPQDAIQDLFIVVGILKKSNTIQPEYNLLCKDALNIISSSERLIELFNKEPHNITVREFLLSL